MRFIEYFVSHIIVIPRIETFLYYRTNGTSFCHLILQNALLAPEQIKQWINFWIVNCPGYSIFYFQLRKLLFDKEMDDAGNSAKNISKIMSLLNKAIILCPVYSVWFVIYELSNEL